MFIDRESKIKLVHGLTLKQIDFCKTLLYGLSNIDLHCRQIIMNDAAKIIVNMCTYSTDRIIPRTIELHLLPTEARIEFMI